MGSVRCVVHTLDLCVNSVLEPGTSWKTSLDHVKEVTSYFKFHTKEKVLWTEIKLSSRVTEERIQRLKHEISTSGHSRVGAMFTNLSQYQNIAKVTDDIRIPEIDVPKMSEWDRDKLGEIIMVIDEDRLVAGQLEADRKVDERRKYVIMSSHCTSRTITSVAEN